MKKLKVPIIVTLILIVLGVGGYFLYQYLFSQNNAKYDDLLSKAEAQVKAHNYAAGLNRYNEAVELVASRKEAYQGVVEVLVLKKQFSSAAEIVNNAESVLGASSSAVAWFEIGKGYYDVADYNNALKHLKLSVDAKKYDDNKMLYAMTLVKVGQLEKVDDYITDSTIGETFKLIWEDYKSNDDNKELTVFNAVKSSRIYLNSDYPYLAISMLEPRKVEMAEYWEGLFYLGKAYYDTAQYDKAIATLEEALTLGSEDSNLYTVIARAYVKADDLNNAYKSYDRAVSFATGQERTSLLKEYLTLLASEKQNSKSEEILSTFADKETIEGLYLYVIYYDLSENTEKLKEYIPLAVAKVTSTWADLYEFNLIATRFYITDKNYEAAQANVEAMLKEDLYDANAKYLEGLIYFNKEKSDQARDSLEAALDYDLTGEITTQAKELLSRIK